MIQSSANEHIKQITKLNQKKYRDQMKMFIVEGHHLVEEAKKHGLIKEIITTDEEIEGTLVTSEVMKKITSTDSLVKECGIVSFPDKKQITNKIIMCDGIQDPGNIGTIIRSAVSFGFKTIVFGKNTVDPFSPKVIRSTQGAIFQINLIFEDIQILMEELKKKDYTIYGTALVNGVPLRNIERKEKMAVILGNEGNGVNKEILGKTDKNIFIEMNNMESLNVGVAGSIIMYELGE